MAVRGTADDGRRSNLELNPRACLEDPAGSAYELSRAGSSYLRQQSFDGFRSPAPRISTIDLSPVAFCVNNVVEAVSC